MARSSVTSADPLGTPGHATVLSGTNFVLKKELPRLPTVIPTTDCTALLRVLSTTLSLLFLDTLLTMSAWSTKSETTLRPTTNATMKNGDGSAVRTVVRNATSSFPTTSLNAVSAVFVLAGAAVATDCELPACYYQSSIAAGGGLNLLASFRIISYLEWIKKYLQRLDQ